MPTAHRTFHQGLKCFSKIDPEMGCFDVLHWMFYTTAAAETFENGGGGKGDTTTLDTLHSQNETQLNSTKAAGEGVRKQSRGLL